tara:strand:- start:307 stop:819 length:513 start_codon:yes stop_codon:yes gene_type:complete
MTAKIKLNAASGGGSVSLEAPTSTTGNANVEFKLPIADGTSGQAVTTNASGQLAFSSISSNIIFAEAVVDGNNGSPSVTRSTGFGSITDNGSGDYTLALSSAQADANYTFLVSTGFHANGAAAVSAVTERNQSNGNERANTTTAVNFGTVNSSGNGVDAFGNIFVACMRG